MSQNFGFKYFPGFDKLLFSIFISVFTWEVHFPCGSLSSNCCCQRVDWIHLGILGPSSLSSTLLLEQSCGNAQHLRTCVVERLGHCLFWQNHHGGSVSVSLKMRLFFFPSLIKSGKHLCYSQRESGRTVKTKLFADVHWWGVSLSSLFKFLFLFFSLR